MRYKTVGVAGLPNSGKSLVANYILKNYGAVVIDYVKDVKTANSIRRNKGLVLHVGRGPCGSLFGGNVDIQVGDLCIVNDCPQDVLFERVDKVLNLDS